MKNSQYPYHDIGRLFRLFLLALFPLPHIAVAIPVADTATASVITNADGSLSLRAAAHDTDGLASNNPGNEFLGETASASYTDTWNIHGNTLLNMSYNFSGTWLHSDVDILELIIRHQFLRGSDLIYQADFNLLAEYDYPGDPAGTASIPNPGSFTGTKSGAFSLPYSCDPTTNECTIDAFVDTVDWGSWPDPATANGPLTIDPCIITSLPATTLCETVNPLIELTEKWTISVSADAYGSTSDPAWLDFANTIDADYTISGESIVTANGRSFSPVPLPASLYLFASGLIGLAGIQCRR